MFDLLKLNICSETMENRACFISCSFFQTAAFTSGKKPNHFRFHNNNNDLKKKKDHILFIFLFPVDLFIF